MIERKKNLVKQDLKLEGVGVHIPRVVPRNGTVVPKSRIVATIRKAYRRKYFNYCHDQGLGKTKLLYLG